LLLPRFAQSSGEAFLQLRHQNLGIGVIPFLICWNRCENYYDSTKVTASVAPVIAIEGIEISGALLTLIANGLWLWLFQDQLILLLQRRFLNLRKNNIIICSTEK